MIDRRVHTPRLWVKPGLPPWGPHVRFRRVQTLVREGSPLVKLRNSSSCSQRCADPLAEDDRKNDARISAQ